MSIIPDHPVQYCRNLHTRFTIFDTLMETVWCRGPKHAREIVASYKNDVLLREFDYYVKGENCVTCFYALLYAEYQKHNREIDVNDIFYFEAVANTEDLEEQRPMSRLIKQKTDPLSDYIYVIEPVGNNQSRVKCAYRTTGKTKLRLQTLQRAFPEGTTIKTILECTPGKMNYLLNNGDSVRNGFEDID